MIPFLPDIVAVFFLVFLGFLLFFRSSVVRSIRSLLGHRSGRRRDPDWVPSNLRGQVYVDERHQTAYVNDALRQDMQTVQWLEDVRETHGLRLLHIEWVPLSVVSARLTEAHLHATSDDEDDENMRNRARDFLKWGRSIGATDIHIRVHARFAVVEVRLDGVLLAADEITTEYADRLMRALYGLCTSGDTTYRETVHQFGTISGDNLRGTGLVNVRVTRSPAAPILDGGQVMAIRLQATKGSSRTRDLSAIKNLRPIKGPDVSLDLQRVGWTEMQADLLRTMVLSPTGTVYFTGPPGSGKTYAIHDMSAYLASVLPGMRQVFIENPVELVSPWTVQLDIPNTLNGDEIGAAYAAYARLALRLDTNYLTYGEILDAQVAASWLSSAEGGMSGMATLHTPDGFEVPSRLRDMDIERFKFTTTCNTSIISGLVAQRMIPLLCDHCAAKWNAADDNRFPAGMVQAVSTWGSSMQNIRRKGAGCEHCTQTSYDGKPWLVAEVVDADETLMADFIQYGTTIARHRYRARSDADTPMLDKAMALVFEGRVDPFDVIRARVGRLRSRDGLLRERERGQKAPDDMMERR